MNWIDVIIVGIVFLAALYGLDRGLTRKVMPMLVWPAAIGVGYLLHKQVATLLTPYIAQPNARLAAAFVGLALLVLILGTIIRMLLSALIEKIGLSWLDRLLGMVMGGASALAVVAMAVFLAGRLTPVSAEPWWRESGTIAVCQQTAHWLMGLAHG